MLQEILLPDATAELGTGTLRGSAEVVALIRSYLDSCGPSQHLLGNQLIDVDGDTAVSRTYVSDMRLGRGSAGSCPSAPSAIITIGGPEWTACGG